MKLLRAIGITMEITATNKVASIGINNRTGSIFNSNQINEIFNSMAEMLHSDNKDTLPKCICNFHKLIVKHWHSMANADAEVVIQSIYDPACIYLCQHVSKGGVDVVIPKEEPPSGRDFI